MTKRPAQAPAHHGGILPLRAAAAESTALVGAKAAGLARARAIGLPVLDGWVVPSGAARAARAAAAGFAAAGRTAQAGLAVMATEPEAWLRAGLERAACMLGGPAIVRSSTPLDDDARWSGAFASYLDVDPGDLVTAVLGCWASVFSRDVTERAAACGVQVPALPLAVLVQPMVRFTAGGVARRFPDGSVRGHVVGGGPAGFLAGRAGAEDFVIDGAALGGGAASAARRDPGDDRGRLAAVADLSRQVYLRTGCDQVEWGWLDGQATLLQCRMAASAAAASPAASRDDVALRTRPASVADAQAGAAPARDGPVLSPAAERSARRLAALAARFPGRLADELILPWAVACAQFPGCWQTGPDDVVAPGRPDGEWAADDRPAAQQAVRHAAAGDASAETLAALCAELTAAAWARPADEAMSAAADTLRLLRAGLHAGALERLGALRPTDPQAVARVLALIAGLGAALERRGGAPRASEIWRHSLVGVRRLLAGTPGPWPACPPSAPQWDGFLAAACAALGRRRPGTAAAPGVAAGAAMFVPATGEIRAPGARRVLVVARPLPLFAPLLWGAAGLVAESGSPGAHLFDVARSLGVPAVADCPLDDDADAAAVVTVDGHGGAAFVLAGPTRAGAVPGAGVGEKRRAW